MAALFDLKGSIRRLIKDKEYSLTIILSMSLGLGIFLFLFAQIYVRAYSPLPFDEGERIVYGSRLENGLSRLDGGLSDFEIRTLLKKQTVLDDLAAFERRRLTLSDSSFTEQINGAATSSNLFKIVNVSPLLGRTIQPIDDEENSPPVIVISFDIWDRLFQRKIDLPGQIINVDGVPTTIVGIMPKGFKFPYNYDAWLSYTPPDLPGPNVNGWNSFAGKLKKEISLEQANDAIGAIAKNIVADYPREYAGKSIRLQQYKKAFIKPVSLLISFMSAVSACVLCMSLLSVVSLIVVKVMENQKEAAIKNALGIPYYRAVAGPLFESFVLCSISVPCGLLVCYLGQLIIDQHITHNSDPFWWKVSMGAYLVLPAILFAIVAWLFTGLLPIYLALRKLSLSQLAGGRKGGGANKTGPFMNSFIPLQISCAFILMLFTSICLYSLYKIANADYGVRPEGYLTAWVQPAASIYPDLSQRVDYFRKLEQQLMQLEEVEGVAFAGAIPGTDSYSSTYTSIDIDLSSSGAFPEINEVPISTNFFDIFNINLIDGRSFVAADDENGDQVVIVSEDIARKISPNNSAVGKKIQLNPDKNGPLLTVIGIAPNLLFGSPVTMYGTNLGALYRPMSQVMPSWYGMRLVVLTKSKLNKLEDKLRLAGRNVDPQVALTKLQPYQDFLSQNGDDFRSLAFNFVPATLIVLCMSGLGIFAIVARTIQQKTNDIGIMKAIGVSDAQINRIFMLDVLLKLAFGLALGGVLFAVLIPDIISKLVIVDYSTLIISSTFVTIALFFVVITASYIPLIKVNKLMPQEAIM